MVRDNLAPAAILNTTDVSETQFVVRLRVDSEDTLAVAPCVPKYIPKTVTETKPDAGELVFSKDDIWGRM
jgi:hypothetical protein